MTHRRFVLTVALTVAGATPVIGQPMTTAFTYQGRLADNGTPANGAFDLRLILFNFPVGGTQVGPTVTLEDVSVAQGLFTVVPDFGAVFTGSRLWLEIGVRPGASTGAFSVVSTRQELTAAPASLFSATAPWTGIVGKPAGFADNVDNDTIYAQGPGLSIAGGVIGIAASGVTTGMILDGTIGSFDLAADSVTHLQIAPDSVGSSEISANAVGGAEIGTDAVGSSEIGTGAVGIDEIATGAVGSDEIANGSVQIQDLNIADLDSRYLNASEVLTSVNYGACGTYSVMSCSLFFPGQAGPHCRDVPVGGICRATGASSCTGASAGVCGDGSGWYLKTGT